MYMGNRTTPMEVLEKRVPKNKKYAHVKANLNTGMTIPKLKTVSTKQFIQRRSEIFNRVGPRTLSDLMQNECSHLAQPPSSVGLDLLNTQSNQDDDGERQGNAMRAAMSQQTRNVIQEEQQHQQQQHQQKGRRLEHTGFYNVMDRRSEQAGNNISRGEAVDETTGMLSLMDRSFLLLDVRPREEFELGSLVGAVSFPLTNFHRDRLGPEIFHFGNRQGKVIVVFDNDERVACIAARELVEKGYENARMLSQGLSGIGNAHPEFVRGQLPAHIIRVKSPSPSHRSHRTGGDGASVSGMSTRTGMTSRTMRTMRSTRTGMGSSVAGSISNVPTTASFSRAPRFSGSGRQEKQQHRAMVSSIEAGTHK